MLTARPKWIIPRQINADSRDCTLLRRVLARKCHNPRRGSRAALAQFSRAAGRETIYARGQKIAPPRCNCGSPARLSAAAAAARWRVGLLGVAQGGDSSRRCRPLFSARRLYLIFWRGVLCVFFMLLGNFVAIACIILLLGLL